MHSLLPLLGIILSLLGVIVCFLYGVRAIQASRRIANFRSRKGYSNKARLSFVAGTLLFILAVILVGVRLRGTPIQPAETLPTPAVQVESPTAFPEANLIQPVSTQTPPEAVVETPSPTGTTAIESPSAAQLPADISSTFRSLVTPDANAIISSFSFATDLMDARSATDNITFQNPLGKIYAVYSYGRITPGTQWTILWYFNGKLIHYETEPWRNAETGLGFALWERPAHEWLPGQYEARIFIGTQLKASGRFTVAGQPPVTPATQTLVPSNTPALTPTFTPTPSPLATATSTLAPTFTSTPSPLPLVTSTLAPTQKPVSTATASVPSTNTPGSAPSRTPSPAPTKEPIPTATSTRTSKPTSTSTNTPTFTPTLTPTFTPTFTPTPPTITVKVYFINLRKVKAGTPPYEDVTSRIVPSSVNPFASVVQEYFKGPTGNEQLNGLTAVSNGFVGFRKIELDEGILRVYLSGYCRSRGGDYSLVGPLTLSLKQFPGVLYVRIYDEYDRTANPDGAGDSAPACAIATYTPTSTRTRTPKPTSTPTKTSTPTLAPTSTATPTFTPTNTFTPTFTPTPPTITVKVYFLNMDRLKAGSPPYEEATSRVVPSSVNQFASVVEEYLKGPTDTEQKRGLIGVTNGFIGFRKIELENGILNVYMTGYCGTRGGDYSLAGPLTLSLKQFPGVKHVKIYDEYGRTGDPVSDSDSAPACALATFTPTASFTPTRTPTATFTRTPTSTSTLTFTPTFTPTMTFTPTATPTMTFTPTLTPTKTFTPTATPTKTFTLTTTPTMTFTPTATPTKTFTPTTAPTKTFTPTSTPTKTFTPAPTPTKTFTPTTAPTKTFTSKAVPTKTFTLTPIPTKTFTLTPIPTKTFTPTAVPTKTFTPTAVPTKTFTPTATPTKTLTPTLAPTRTFTPTAVPAKTLTPTLAPTKTFTPTATPTKTFTQTAAPTKTFTPTAIPTKTFTPRPTPTKTFTPTPIPTKTFTPTSAPTKTFTPTALPTKTFTPTSAPTKTSTSTPSPTLTPTATVDPNCNRGFFVTDVSIPDGTTVNAFASFTKIWRLKNTGACRWTKDYRLLYIGGTRMGAPESIALPVEVPPGGLVDISVIFTAPEKPGYHESIWMLQSPDGVVFGVGPAANQPVWAKVRVIPVSQGITPTTFVPQGTPTITPTTISRDNVSYDFAGNACQAEWMNNENLLSCPGLEGEPGGAVLPLGEARLENGTVLQLPSLLMLPPVSVVGSIQGTYPEYEVQAGDHLQAVVGCQADALPCSVLFRVAYLDSQGVVNDLWNIGEFYDGQLFNVDLDLTSLSGQRVRFILSVSSLGDSVGDRALWIAPGILRVSAPLNTPEPVNTAAPTTTPIPATSTPTGTPAVIPVTATPTPVGEVANQGSPSLFQQLVEFLVSFFNTLFGN